MLFVLNYKDLRIRGGTGMTPKEYLSQVRRLDVLIKQRLEQKEELLQLNGLVGRGISERVQSSPKGEASFVRIVEKIESLEAEITALIDKYVDLKRVIIGQIQALPDVKYSQVLYKRYVEGKRLEAIALEMGCSYHRLKHVHGYALKAFGDHFPACLKNDT